jgi:DNA-binding protein YbaB
MFDKFKQLKQLKDLQGALQQEKMEIEKEGTKVVINGAMQVEEIQLNRELAKEEQEKILREAINEVMKKMQMTAAQKMSQLKGFGF